MVVTVTFIYFMVRYQQTARLTTVPTPPIQLLQKLMLVAFGVLQGVARVKLNYHTYHQVLWGAVFAEIYTEIFVMYKLMDLGFGTLLLSRGFFGIKKCARWLPNFWILRKKVISNGKDINRSINKSAIIKIECVIFHI